MRVSLESHTDYAIQILSVTKSSGVEAGRTRLGLTVAASMLIVANPTVAVRPDRPVTCPCPYPYPCPFSLSSPSMLPGAYAMFNSLANHHVKLASEYYYNRHAGTVRVMRWRYLLNATVAIILTLQFTVYYGIRLYFVRCTQTYILLQSFAEVFATCCSSGSRLISQAET